jgi:dTMP kinase
LSRKEARATSIFITIEGLDGAGKSLQAKNAYNYLSSLGFDVEMVREPGGDAVSERIRGLLSGGGDITDMAECLLFAAARAQTVENIIRPALNAGKIVVCDRFLDSSVAYQGFGRGLLDAVTTINSFAVGGLTPRLTILLDLDPEIALSRKREDFDRIERSGADFFDRTRRGYLTLAELEPDRIATVDASGNPDEVWLAAREKIDGVLCGSAALKIKKSPRAADI